MFCFQKTVIKVSIIFYFSVESVPLISEMSTEWDEKFEEMEPLGLLTLKNLGPFGYHT